MSAHPGTNPGGPRNFVDNERFGFEEAEEIGWAAIASVFDVLAAALLQTADRSSSVAPQSGVFREGFKVTYDSGMDVTVASGIGLYYDSTETDPHKPKYKPIVLLADETLTVGDNSSGSTRIDIISVAPLYDDDNPETITQRTSGFGASTATTSLASDTRTAFAANVVLTPGTPGGGAPSLPAGHIPLAGIEVVTGSNAGSPISDADITDDRDRLGVPAQNLSMPPKTLQLTVGAEASNVIPIAIQVQDVDGNDTSTSFDNDYIEVELLTAGLELASDTTYGLDVGATGSAQSSTGKTRFLMRASAGAAVLNVQDKSAVATDTLYVRAQVVNYLSGGQFGPPVFTTLTFA